MEITALTRSRSPSVEYINITEHLFTTLEERAKRRSEVVITKTLTQREVLKKKQKTGKTDQLRTQRTFQ